MVSWFIGMRVAVAYIIRLVLEYGVKCVEVDVC